MINELVRFNLLSVQIYNLISKIPDLLTRSPLLPALKIRMGSPHSASDSVESKSTRHGRELGKFINCQHKITWDQEDMASSAIPTRTNLNLCSNVEKCKVSRNKVVGDTSGLILFKKEWLVSDGDSVGERRIDGLKERENLYRRRHTSTSICPLRTYFVSSNV